MPDALALYVQLAPPITPRMIAMAIADGMLSKETLRDGVFYEGFCRNATCARWDAELGEFWYHVDGRRDTVPYAADWDGWDMFVPVGEADPYDIACYFG